MLFEIILTRNTFSPQHVNSTYWLLAIVSCGDEDFVTEAKEIKNVREQKSVVLPADFTFSNVTSDFIVDITIYCMTTKQVKTEKLLNKKAALIIYVAERTHF